MTRFQLSLRTKLERTPRAVQLESLFDVPRATESEVAFDFELPLFDDGAPDWSVGLIVGPSGAGKSSVARELFGDAIVAEYDWHRSRSIADSFPEGLGIREVTDALSSVGFSSPPSWLRPYGVLSNGEKFRATMARALVDERDLVVIDEFTSVVDRTVAKSASAAISKAVRRRAGKKFVAVTCHYDVEEWLQPDWVLEPHLGAFRWRSQSRHPTIDLKLVRVRHAAWRWFAPHHYLSRDLNRSAKCFAVLLGDGTPVAFVGLLPLVHSRVLNTTRVSRVVVLPDYQGLGLGRRVLDLVGSVTRAVGRSLMINTSHPALVAALARSDTWTLKRKPSFTSRMGPKSTLPRLDKTRAAERFETLEQLEKACREYQASAIEKEVPFGVLRVEASGGDLSLVGKAGVPARLTHWAFGQLCQRASAPASYLRDLPATLAAQNLNHGLAARQDDPDTNTQLLFHRNGSLVLRAMTSEKYARIWNGDIVGKLREALPAGWQTPPARPAREGQRGARPATAADVLANSQRNSPIAIKEGDLIAPAGLYVSDHDLFVFQVNEGRAVDDGSGHALSRGFFLWNSEVGASSFGITTFLYDAICGNHIVWGAKNVTEIKIRHVGDANKRRAFREVGVELTRYADESASETEAQIVAARKYVLGASKEEAVDSLLKLLGRKVHVSQKVLGDAYDAAELADRYGAPGTVWGMVNGITEVSQRTAHADERVKLDRVAGRVMDLVF